MEPVRRVGDIGKTHGDLTGWRNEASVRIRKAARDDMFAKRREFAMGGPNGDGEIKSDPMVSTEQEKPMTPAEVVHFCSQLRSPEVNDVLPSIMRLRKSLSQDKCPPLQAMVANGCVPPLINLLGGDFSQFPEGVEPKTQAKIQFEAAWCLTNVCSGDHECTTSVLDAGGDQIFLKLLFDKSAPQEIRDQALWAVGNITGDCVEYRDRLISHGVVAGLKEMLLDRGGVTMKTNDSTFYMNLVWVCSNFARGKPTVANEVAKELLEIVERVHYLNSDQVIADAFWTLGYLTDGACYGKKSDIEQVHRRIDYALTLAFPEKLVRTLSSNKGARIKGPALRCVGNIVAGTQHHTDVMIHAGVIPALRTLLTCSMRSLQKESCWALSNITAGTEAQIGKVIAENVFETLAAVLPTVEAEIAVEGCWLVANACCGASFEQAAQIIQSGVMAPMFNQMSLKNAQIARTVLDCLWGLLTIGEHRRELVNLEENPFMSLLEQNGAVDMLDEVIQYDRTPAFARIIDTADRIVKTYVRRADGESFGARQEDYSGTAGEEFMDDTYYGGYY